MSISFTGGGGGVSFEDVANAISATALTTTDDLAEGVQNLYFSPAHLQAVIGDYPELVGAQGIQGTTGVGSQGVTGIQGFTGAQGTEGSFGGVAFEYVYASSTSMSDPGNTYIRFNAALASATHLVIDDNNAANTDIHNYLRTIDDSTSTIKGHVKVSKLLSPDIFALYAINSMQDLDTYFNITISYLSGNGSFTNQDPVLLTFARTGDIGAQGVQGIQGRQGTQGLQGRQGTTGLQGTTGIGSQGAQGVTGAGYLTFAGARPASNSASGTKGTVYWDNTNNFFYICVNTNSWIRFAASDSFTSSGD